MKNMVLPALHPDQVLEELRQSLNQGDAGERIRNAVTQSEKDFEVILKAGQIEPDGTIQHKLVLISK